jgi:hypothetical protein
MARMFEIKIYKYIRTSIFLFCIAAIITSCSPRPNTRWFIKDNIKFWANLYISPDGNHYHILEIGTPENTYKGSPALFIKLPGNKVISLRDTDGNFIKEIGERTTVAKGEYPVDWPKGAELIYLGAYTFVVHDNQVLNFSARHFGSDFWKENPAIIGSTSDGPFLKFPLKESEVKQLLGEPKEIRDFFKY